MPKLRKTWFNIQKSTNGKPASVIIEGEIGEWGLSSQDFRASFARLGESENVQMHICSGGGSVFDGQEIANIIRGHKGEVNATLGSICASIATVIACAADKVTASKNTVYMVHRASAYATGDADDMRKAADVMELVEKGIVAAYVQKTGGKEDDLQAMVEEETWMDAEQAKEFGFVDDISDDESDDDVIDNVAIDRYKNTTYIFKRLQSQIAGGLAKATGNGKHVTLAALRNAVTSPPKQTVFTPQIPTMTPEEIAAQKAANDKLISDGVKAALVARNARAKEIKDFCAAILKRDKKDFSALAEEYIDSDQDTNAFLRAVQTSEKFKIVGNVGSGIEVTEPLDGLKGSIGFQFVTSESFRDLGERIKRRGGSSSNMPINASHSVARYRNTQTSTATSGSGLTSIEKLPGVVELGVRPLTFEDLIAGGQTNSTTIRYIQEVTFTEAATTVAETGALPALTMTYQEIDSTVKDVGGYVKMSDNLLADYAAVASFINMRLPYQVDRQVEDQLVNGGGTGTDLTGILNFAGIQTIALGANSRPDVALKLQTLVRWQSMTSGQAQGGFEPDFYLCHPTDWETLVLTKDANGQYLCRGPFTGSYGNPAEQDTVGSIVEFYTLWGKKVAISPVIAQGTLLCGAGKMGAQKFDRQGLIIEMSNSDGTDFLSRVVTLRGTRRLALAVYRPGSFAQATGL